jgi:hypothetical protein
MATIYFLPNIAQASTTMTGGDRSIYALTQADPFFNDLLTQSNGLRARAGQADARFIGRDGSLAGITAADTFYVFGHGDYRGSETSSRPSPMIRTKWGGGQEMGPEDLAALLRERRLPDLEGLVVRVFACNSGVRNPRDGRTFAHRTALHMGVCGYHAVKVSGYVGVVSLSNGVQLMVHKEVDLTNPKAPVQSNSKPASQREVTYNVSGFIVSGREGAATRSRSFFTQKDTLRIRYV